MVGLDGQISNLTYFFDSVVKEVNEGTISSQYQLDIWPVTMLK